MKIPQWFIHILTQADNLTFDHGKVISLLCFFSYILLSIIALAIFHKFDCMNFATGASAMAVGFGVHLKLNNEGEKPNGV